MKIDHLNIIIKEVKNEYNYDYAIEFIVFGLLGLIASLIFYGLNLVYILIASAFIIFGIFLVLLIYFINSIKKDKYFKIDTIKNTITIKKKKLKIYRLNNVRLQVKIIVDDENRFGYKLTIYHEGKKVYKTNNGLMESKYFQGKDFVNKLNDFVCVEIIKPKSKKKDV